MKKPDKPLLTYNKFLNRIAESDLTSNARIVGVMLLNKCNREGWEQPFLMSERSLRHDTGIMKRTELLRALRQLSEQKFICHNGDYYVLNLAHTQKDFLSFSYPEWEFDGEKTEEHRKKRGMYKEDKRKNIGESSEEHRKTRGMYKEDKKKNIGESSEELKSVNDSNSGDYLFDQTDMTRTSTADFTASPAPDQTRSDKTRQDQIRSNQTRPNQTRPDQSLSLSQQNFKSDMDNKTRCNEKTERERDEKNEKMNDEESEALDRIFAQTEIKDNANNRERLKALYRKYGAERFDAAVGKTAANSGKSVRYLETVLANEEGAGDRDSAQHVYPIKGKEEDCHNEPQHKADGGDCSPVVEKTPPYGFDEEGYAIDGGPFDFTPERLATITDINELPDPDDFSVDIPMPRRFAGTTDDSWIEYCKAISDRRKQLIDNEQLAQ